MLKQVMKENKALFDYIKENDGTIIVDGEQGPIGKTTLANGLRDLGYPAFERWEVALTDVKEPYCRVIL